MLIMVLLMMAMMMVVKKKVSPGFDVQYNEESVQCINPDGAFIHS